MASGQISKRAVDLLQPAVSTQFLWDRGGRDSVNGFGVRVTPAGIKSYVFQYRLGGREARTRRITIGKHGAWTPDTARSRAKELERMVDAGIDPAEADKERRRQAVDLAFSTYVGRFFEGYLRSRWKRPDEAHRLLIRDAVAVLGKKPLPALTRADLNALWERMANRPALARQMFAVMRKLFRWAVERGDIDRSPMEGSSAPPAVAARDRVLTDKELQTLWLAVSSIGTPYEGFYKLLIATGQRKDEVARLPWKELDRAAAVWLLPPERAKNGVAHIIPLSPLALASIDSIAGKAEWPQRGFVFTTGKAPIANFSRHKARLDKKVDELSVSVGQAKAERWRTHDIRRTVATGLQRLGVRFEVTEAVLNHVSGAKAGIAGVYQRHDWADEKRMALNAWGEHIDRLILNITAE